MKGAFARGGGLKPRPTFLLAAAPRGTIPDRLIVTAQGVAGLYASEVANGAFDAVWTDRVGRLHASTISTDVR